MDIVYHAIFEPQVLAVAAVVPVADKHQRHTAFGKGLQCDVAFVFRLYAAYRQGISFFVEHILVQYAALFLLRHIAQHMVSTVGYQFRTFPIFFFNISLYHLVVGNNDISAPHRQLFAQSEIPFGKSSPFGTGMFQTVNVDNQFLMEKQTEKGQENTP